MVFVGMERGLDHCEGGSGIRGSTSHDWDIIFLVGTQSIL